MQLLVASESRKGGGCGCCILWWTGLVLWWAVLYHATHILYCNIQTRVVCS